MCFTCTASRCVGPSCCQEGPPWAGDVLPSSCPNGQMNVLVPPWPEKREVVAEDLGFERYLG